MPTPPGATWGRPVLLSMLGWATPLLGTADQTKAAGRNGARHVRNEQPPGGAGTQGAPASWSCPFRVTSPRETEAQIKAAAESAAWVRGCRHAPRPLSGHPSGSGPRLTLGSRMERHTASVAPLLPARGPPPRTAQFSGSHQRSWPHHAP
ncbi:hypothetical protein NDU88_002900 [Pleurodeles waltl]|uniref:Secreted protein n=1 Tax=Pleurodeles waltl TaxID=8319 RepID=A0AAV7MQR6_PLEWA|nr:hypothetical protein NDU88_002900 [Pleurodeles waltl]